MTAYTDITSTITVIEDERKESEFTEVFNIVDSMAAVSGCSLTIPRICTLQRHRSNVQSSSPKSYYKHSVVIPMYDSLLCELKSRFTQLSKSATIALKLVPFMASKVSSDDVSIIKKTYLSLMPEPCTFEAELKRYKALCATSGSLPTGFDCKSILSFINSALYPNIFNIMKAVFTFPVTSANVERANSSLKFIKSDRRATMTDDRLNALLLLFVHRNIQIDYDEIVTAFGSQHSRRLDFSET